MIFNINNKLSMMILKMMAGILMWKSCKKNKFLKMIIIYINKQKHYKKIMKNKIRNMFRKYIYNKRIIIYNKIYKKINSYKKILDTVKKQYYLMILRNNCQKIINCNNLKNRLINKKKINHNGLIVYNKFNKTIIN